MANDASAQIDNYDGIYFTSQYKIKEAMESRIAPLNEIRTSSTNEEYVYWGCNVSNDRQANDHDADVVYYDIDPTYFETVFTVSGHNAAQWPCRTINYHSKNIYPSIQSIHFVYIHGHRFTWHIW